MLTKSDIAARATDAGRPISRALAGTILTATGGCENAVDVALEASRRVDADMSVTKVVVDAVHAHRVAYLAALSRAEQSVVALAHFGAESDTEVLAELTEGAADPAAVRESAVAAGVLAQEPPPLSGVTEVLLATLGAPRLSEILTTLLEYRSKTDTLDADMAVAIAGAGVRHPQLALFLTLEGDGAEPESAANLYSCAVDAGAEPLSLAAQRADVAAVLGDLDAAEQFGDHILEHSDSVTAGELRSAIRTSATVAAERGMTERGRQLYEWLGPDRAGSDAPLAAVVASVAGVVPTVTAVTTAPPTSASAALTLLAGGLQQSITAESTAETTAATNTLMRAVSLSGADVRRAAPETASATAILFALHCGDLGRVESLVSRSTAPMQHPSGTRIALLHTWASMLSGDVAAAASRIETMQIPSSHSRNRLFFHAIGVGLARRSGDRGALINAWNDAQDVIAEYSADLFSLLPIGELWLGSVRVGRPDRMTHLLAQVDSVLAGLHEPSAWASAFHWYGVQAAIAAENPAELVPHARALASAAESNRYSATLASAGRAWLGVLQGHPNVSDVEAAAHSLTQFGLSWDGARLAGEAALRVADTRAATTLLQVARSLRQPVAAPTAVTAEPKGALSAREAEVAEMLVLGITYREAGNRLYISAKTVEHHVARIKRRLGAGSRSELLSMLRGMGYGTTV